MQIEYALFWIIMAVLMIIMSVFPQIVYWITTVFALSTYISATYVASTAFCPTTSLDTKSI